MQAPAPKEKLAGCQVLGALPSRHGERRLEPQGSDKLKRRPGPLSAQAAGPVLQVEAVVCCGLDIPSAGRFGLNNADFFKSMVCNQCKTRRAAISIGAYGLRAVCAPGRRPQ